jgi:hypothetical protein
MRSIATPIFFCCSWKVILVLFLFWGETIILRQELVLRAQSVRPEAWGVAGNGACTKRHCPPPHLGWVTLSAQARPSGSSLHSLPVYVCLCAFIFPFIHFWGVAVGHSHLCVWLAALDACQALSMDYLSYGRRYCCAQGPASLCKSVPVYFTSSPCECRVRACVALLQFSVDAFASAGS